MRQMIGVWVAVTAGGLAVASCGSADTASGAAVAASGDDDPCTLLTKAEMTEITTDVVTYTDRNGATCTYHSDPKDGVQVTVYRTGGGRQMATVRASAKLLGAIGSGVADQGGAGHDVGTLLKADKSAAPAIGDEAVWELNDTLAVRKGDSFVEASPPIMHDPVTHSGPPLVTKEEKRVIAQAIATKLLQKIAP